jgi:hypothetical protein
VAKHFLPQISNHSRSAQKSPPAIRPAETSSSGPVDWARNVTSQFCPLRRKACLGIFNALKNLSPPVGIEPLTLESRVKHATTRLPREITCEYSIYYKIRGTPGERHCTDVTVGHLQSSCHIFLNSAFPYYLYSKRFRQ